MARAAPETYSLRGSRILTLPRTHDERRTYLLRSLIVAGLFVVSAKAGLSLSVAHGSATPVWTPTGISLSALLIFGTGLWPAVAAGAFIANLTTPIPIGAAPASRWATRPRPSWAVCCSEPPASGPRSSGCGT